MLRSYSCYYHAIIIMFAHAIAALTLAYIVHHSCCYTHTCIHAAILIRAFILLYYTHSFIHTTLLIHAFMLIYSYSHSCCYTHTCIYAAIPMLPSLILHSYLYSCCHYSFLCFKLTLSSPWFIFTTQFFILHAILLHAYNTSCLPFKLTHTACLPLSSSCFMLATFMLLSCYHNHTCTHAVNILMIISFPYLHPCYYVTHAWLMLVPPYLWLLTMSHVIHAAIMLFLPPYATQSAILRRSHCWKRMKMRVSLSTSFK